MTDVNIVSFDDALQDSEKYPRRHLLLGNGFSIACVPSIFTYSSLYQQADFSDVPEVKVLFDKLGTQDFELVISCLENGSVAIPVYLQDFSKTADIMCAHAKRLKELLVETVAKNHPEYPSEIDESKYVNCLNFLKWFLDSKGRVYTFNYDLLLYWTLMYGMEKKLIVGAPNDGFGRDTDFYDGESHVSDYVTWQGDTNAHNQNIHYLHGALHIFDRGPDVEKFVWHDKNVRLIDQSRQALEQGKFPLFVSEGESDKKMDKITHSGYLYHSYKSFSATMGAKPKVPNCLFTYGVSFTDNDWHIAKKIAEGRVKHLYVSIYGDPYSDDNQRIINYIEMLKRRRRDDELEVTFYNAESAAVWG